MNKELEKVIEAKKEEFRRELIPVDFMLEMAGEKRGTDRAVDLVVAKFHEGRIELFLSDAMKDGFRLGLKEALKVVEREVTGLCYESTVDAITALIEQVK